MKFAGKVKNGNLTLDRETLKDFLLTIDGDVIIRIEKASPSRSPQQNNYYWILVEMLGNELGYTKEEMHKTLKFHFQIDSTKNLQLDEFNDYITKIIRYSAIELNIALPDPRK